jgi:hypothetical protein
MDFEAIREKYLWGRLEIILVLLELVLSVIFLLISYLIRNDVTGSAYIRGVGVGLVIAWATGAIAYFIRKKKVKS